MVANFDKSSESGSHWVAIYAPNKFHVYYFDSIASLPIVEDIRRYLETNFRYVTRQTKPIQEPGTTVCGQYAIFFIYLCARNFSVHQIRYILEKSGNPDKFVDVFVRKNVIK